MAMESQPTLFAEASHASPFPSPGLGEARRMTAISGRKWRGLYPRSGPVGCLLRMLLESTDWRSTEFFLTWKASATKQRRRLKFRLVPSMPRTVANGSGSWPTPQALSFDKSHQPGMNAGMAKTVANIRTAKRSRSATSRTNATETIAGSPGTQTECPNSRQRMPSTWPTPRAGDGSKATRTPEGAAKEVARNKGPDLGAVASWTTPQAHDTSPGKAKRMNRHGTKHGDRNLNDEAAAWATPTAQDHSRGTKPPRPQDTGVPLSQQIAPGKTPNGSTAATASAGALNPEFVCWLQGFPSGWLNLEPSGTP
ncbi:hypothetical protein LCGC14_1842230 [marine sediment metagenome]|uniref:Uncharacterized protein n=1 Tax=marine sediment metagenome TaxID=412755 RepID=A0A0F9GCZ5_9ZZZZ